MAPLWGSASGGGTLGYTRRVSGGTGERHFRRMGELRISSIGLGTYLGPADDRTDGAYRAAVIRALELGLNVIDTASNYRHQRSERAVGSALAEAVERGVIARDEVVVAWTA